MDRPPIYSRPFPPLSEISGSVWSKRRKYASSTVFSVTKSSFILSNIKTSINKYLEPKLNDIRGNDNKLWYPSQDLYCISLNTILSATFNIILPFDDPFIANYAKFANESFDRATLMILVEMILDFKTPLFIKRRIVWDCIKKGDDLLIEWMRNHGFIVDLENNILKRKNNDNDTDEVYVDFLISKLAENEIINVENIIADIHNILSGAIDTTSKSAEYGFLLLAKYPDIQETIYKEMKDVMKQNNLKEFEFSIITQLHVFRAFIYEVLRISSVIPTGLPHMTSKDHVIDIDGNKIVIPRKTMCHQNTYFMHKYLDWNDGNKILDEENNSIHLDYWLKDDGNGNKKFKINDNFILFGVGKRDCVGQSLAIKAMYAVFGMMINKYKFKANNDDSNGMSIKQEWGVVMRIDPPVGIMVEKR